jgi:hypothetical protein
MKTIIKVLTIAGLMAGTILPSFAAVSATTPAATVVKHPTKVVVVHHPLHRTVHVVPHVMKHGVHVTPKVTHTL